MASTKIYKFVVAGSDVTMFEAKKGGFVADTLDANQSLSFDAVTGDVTLRETYADHIELKVFHQTADQTDDASFYVKGEESATTLDGTPIILDDADHDGHDDDTINGGTGDDHRHGGAGDDHMNGGGGADDLNGDDGNDVMQGGSGDDSLHGGTGDDKLDGGKGADHEFGDDGADHINGNDGNDDLNGGAGDDAIVGGNGADDVTGDDGNDKVAGGNGDDHVGGGAGDDKVTGGAGDDQLSGGSGKDALTGGLGADSFVFTDGDFSGSTIKTADRVSDFNHAQGDHVDLSGVDADTTVDGDQGFSFIGTAAFGGHAGELRYDVVRGNALISGDTNGDGVADFAIRLDHVASLAAEDFVL